MNPSGSKVRIFTNIRPKNQIFVKIVPIIANAVKKRKTIADVAEIMPF